MKGISPLIASVLLIGFTMSVAILAGPFFSDIQQSTQRSNTEKAEKVLKSIDLSIAIKSASYNRTTSNLTLTIQNTGDQPLSNLSITVIGDQAYQKTYDRRLKKREISEFKIYSGDHWDLKKSGPASKTTRSQQSEGSTEDLPNNRSPSTTHWIRVLECSRTIPYQDKMES